MKTDELTRIDYQAPGMLNVTWYLGTLYEHAGEEPMTTARTLSLMSETCARLHYGLCGHIV